LITTHKPKEAVEIISKYSKSPIERKDRFSPNFLNFLESCLKINTSERSSTQELLKHYFLQGDLAPIQSIRVYAETAKRLRRESRK
jgi:serine/threonine protein kinase